MMPGARPAVRPPTRRRRWAAAGTAVALFCLAAFYVRWAAVTPLRPGSVERVRVDIPSGSSSWAVARQLASAGVIRSPLVAMIWATVHGERHRLEAGTYLFGPGMSAAAVLEAIASGAIATVTVVAPEGDTVAELAENLQTAGLWPAAAFRKAARAAGPLLRGAGLPVPGRGVRYAAEGFLFPDTYRFRLSAAPSAVVEEMLRTFQQQFAPLRTTAVDAGLNARETVILASIVQREVPGPHDMALIAGVYLRRLRAGMTLDADPSVLYGLGLLGAQSGALTTAELHSRSAYNTYLHRGWPPGPICNPGLAALRAAASPLPGTAMYFLTARDGRVVLADSLAQQEQNQLRYLGG